jgi:hypothetical protein
MLFTTAPGSGFPVRKSDGFTYRICRKFYHIRVFLSIVHAAAAAGKRGETGGRGGRAALCKKAWPRGILP